MNFNMETISDLAPFLILSEIWPDLAKITRAGRIRMPVRRVLIETRIADALGLRIQGYEDGQNIWAFPRDKRHDAGTSTSTTRFTDVPRRDIVAPRVAGQVDQWIQEVTERECELSDQGRRSLISLITELLDNAERHSSPADRDGAWTISAFMEKRTGANPSFVCHLAILSFGATFAESLAGAGPRSARIISDYLGKQRRTKQSQATLRTLAALQDYVTGDGRVEADGRLGGTGLMHALNFVNQLGGGCPGEEPQLVIVSGNSCVRCRVPYLTATEDPATRQRTLWFNDANDPTIAPNERFVHDLRRRFPGTAISVRFNMNGAHLRKLANDNHGHGDEQD